MRKNLSFMSTICNEELGVDMNEPVDVEAIDTADNANVLRKALSAKPKSKAKPKPRLVSSTSSESIFN